MVNNRLISRADEFKLWSLSAGRCQICNIPIYEDQELSFSGNFAHKAHIKAVSRGGPRHDPKKNGQEVNSFDNVMLLCTSHHKLIDDYAQYFQDEKLINIKRRHEDRIRKVTENREIITSTIVTYFYMVDNNEIMHNRNLFNRALYDSGYVPQQGYPVDFSVENYAEVRNKEMYEREVERLTIVFNRTIKSMSLEKEAISIFSLAPIPLLIKLGTLINDQFNVKVFQCHRTGEKWSWRQDDDSPEFINQFPKGDLKDKKVVALNISISADIHNHRITDVIGKEIPIYKLTVKQDTSRSIIKTESTLNNYVETFRNIVEIIKRDTSAEIIKVFPAIPNSVAIRTGMDMMLKTDPKFIIYDEEKSKSSFIETIKVNGDD